MAGLVRRLFGRPAPADPDQDGAPPLAPVPAPVDADDGRAGWVDLPPTPSAVGSPSLTVQTSAFEETLATRHNPLFLEPLGHHVSGGAPSGIVHGIAEVVSHPPSPAPGVTVQTFAPRPPRVEDLRGALVPQLAPTSPEAVDGTGSGAVPAAPSLPVLQRTAVASSGVDPVGSSPPVSFTRAPDPAPLPRVLEVTAQDPMPVDAVHTDPASETETVAGRAVDHGIERQAPTLNRADDEVAPASPELPAVAGRPDGHLPTVDLPTIQRSLDAGSALNEPASLSPASLWPASVSPASVSPASVSPVDQGAAAIAPSVEAPAPLLQSPPAPAGAVGGDLLDSSVGTAVSGMPAIAPTIDHSPPSMQPSSTTAPVRPVQRLGLGEPIRPGDRSPLSDPLPLQRRVEATSAGTPAPASPASAGIGESTPQAEAAFTEHAGPVLPALPEVGKGIVAQAASSSESIGDGGSTEGVEVEEAPLIGAGAPSASPPFALLPEPATTNAVSGGTRDTPPPLAVQTLPEQTTRAEAGDISSMPEAADAAPPVGSMPAGVTNPDATDPVGVVPTRTTGVAPMSAPLVGSGSVEPAPALASRPVQRAGSREVGSAPLGSAPVPAHRATEVPVVQRQVLADGGEDTNVGTNSSVGTGAASPLPVAPWPLGEGTGAAHATEPNTADLGAGEGPAAESGQSPLSLPQVALMSARPLIAPSLSQSSGPRPSSGPVVSRWMDGRVDDHRGDQQGNASTDQSPAFRRSPEPEPTPFWTAISRLPVDDPPPSGPNALPGPVLVAQRAPGPQPATGSVAVGRLSLGAPVPVKAGTAPDLPLVLPAAAPARGQVIQREVEVPQDAPVPSSSSTTAGTAGAGPGGGIH